MNRKIIAMLLALVLAVSLAACGGGGQETTLTGMVVSLDGTVVSLVEMGEMNFTEGERPQMPGGMVGNFPEDFDGTMPEGFEGNFPEGFDGTMPEDFEGKLPEDFEGKLPEGFGGGFPGGMPEGFDGTLPEGETIPQKGDGAFSGDMETKQLDISGAHISLEIDGGKASGTLEDIQPGSFVTVTLNSKGEATYVLISSQSGFGGRQ